MIMVPDKKSFQLQKDENITPLSPKKENDGKYEYSIILFLKGALKSRLQWNFICYSSKLHQDTVNPNSGILSPMIKSNRYIVNFHHLPFHIMSEKHVIGTFKNNQSSVWV